MNYSVATWASIILLVGTLAGASDTRADANVTGVWDVAVDVASQSAEGTPRFELNQIGQNVGGIYRGQFGERPVLGTVSGDEIELHFQIDSESGPIPVRYQGTVVDNALSGSVSFGDVAEGSFTATRVQ